MLHTVTYTGGSIARLGQLRPDRPLVWGISPLLNSASRPLLVTLADHLPEAPRHYHRQHEPGDDAENDPASDAHPSTSNLCSCAPTYAGNSPVRAL